MKTTVFVFLSSIFLFSFGCSNNDDLSESDSDAALIGNKWKLVGFVNGEDGRFNRRL